MSVDIGRVLDNWPYQSEGVMARLIAGNDGRKQLQLRLDLGVLQMDVDGRPDGETLQGYPSWLACLAAKRSAEPDQNPSSEDWSQLDREIMQFYHRRTALMALAQQAQLLNKRRRAIALYRRALRDANHNLQAMNFIVSHSDDPQYAEGHERYRPLVLAQRGLAAGHWHVLRGDPDLAIERVKAGIRRIERFYHRRRLDDLINEDAGVRQLRILERQIRREHVIDRTLQEQLDDALANEDYKLAAQIRDKIDHRNDSK